MKFESYFLTVVLCAFSVLPVLAQPNVPPVVPPKIVRPQRQVSGPIPQVTWDELKPQIGGPTLLTLHAKAMPAAQIVAELNRQTPLEIRNDTSFERQDEQKLTADYQAQPFWDVLFDIEKKMDARFFKDDDTTRGADVRFWPFAASHGPLARSGPCVFELLRGTFSRTVLNYFNPEKPTEALNFETRIYLDPKLRALSEAKIQLDEATDEKGQSLLKDNALSPSYDGALLDTKIALNPLATRGKKLSRLRGTYRGAFALQSVAWEVPEVMNARAVEKTFGDGMRVEMQEVKQVGDEYQVLIVWSQTGKEAPRRMSNGLYLSDFSNIYDDLRLVDAKGRALIKRDVKGESAGDRDTNINAVTVTFQANENGGESQRTTAPAKLILHYDFDWRELIVPFEFKDIPLP